MEKLLIVVVFANANITFSLQKKAVPSG